MLIQIVLKLFSPDLVGVTVATVSIGQNLSITTGNGGDSVSLSHVTASAASINTGAGADTVSITSSSAFKTLNVYLGAGNDSLTIDSSVTVSQSAYLDGGPGTNHFFGTGPTGSGKVTKKNFS